MMKRSTQHTQCNKYSEYCLEYKISSKQSTPCARELLVLKMIKFYFTKLDIRKCYRQSMLDDKCVQLLTFFLKFQFQNQPQVSICVMLSRRRRSPFSEYQMSRPSVQRVACQIEKSFYTPFYLLERNCLEIASKVLKYLKSLIKLQKIFKKKIIKFFPLKISTKKKEKKLKPILF